MSEDGETFNEHLALYVSAYSVARMASGRPMTAVEIIAALLSMVSSVIDQCPLEARPALLEASHSTLDTLAELPMERTLQ
jgi:hypothetical protein